MGTHIETIERLRACRALAGLKQSEVSDLSVLDGGARIAQPNIARYESGNSNPSSATADRLFTIYRNASSAVAEMLDSVDGVLGVQGRAAGKLGIVSDVLATPTPKEWAVENFLALGFMTIVAGQEGSGKSMLTQTAAVAFARGEGEVFGFRMPMGRPLRTLIIDAENIFMNDEDDIEASIVQERLQRFAGGLDGDTQLNVTVCAASMFDLDKDNDVLDGILKDAATEGRPYDVLVLDSLRSLCTVNENTSDIGRVVIRLNRLAAKHHVAILLLHHTNKNKAAYSGHTSIGSNVAMLWTFSRLVHKNPLTGLKEQHPTVRLLNPYKVRIAAEPVARTVRTSGDGLISQVSASEYDGYVADDAEEEEE